MKSKSEIFQDSIKLTRALIQARLVPLLLLLLVTFWVNSSVEEALQLPSPSQDNQRWIVQLSAGIYELCAGVLLFMLLSWAVPTVRKFSTPKLLQKPFATPYLTSFFAEYLRMLAQCLMFGLLLLIPGFVRYGQLIFMPLIALFGAKYREGDQDAMRLSQRMTRGRLLPLLALLFFLIGIETLIEYLPQLSPELHILPLRIVCSATGFLISVWAYSLIFVLFENLIQTVPDEEE